MGRWVRRLMLDDLFAIGRNEHWFAHMAKRGLHLRKFGRTFAYFEQGEPRETRYRIEYLQEEPAPEQLEVYGECGWNLAARGGKFYVFVAEEAWAVELHTDPIEQGFALAELNKRMKLNVVIITAAVLLIIGMISSIYFLNNQPYLAMVRGNFVQQLLLVVVEIYLCFTVIRNYLAVRRLRASLLQGNPIDHEEGYAKARRLSAMIFVLIIPLALGTIVLPFVEIAKRDTYTLPESKMGLPMICLAEIEQNPKLERESSYYEDLDFLNRVEYDWRLLAPVQYEINEHGVIKGELWEDGSGEYSPSVITRYYQLAYGGMAAKLMEDMMERYVEPYEDEEQRKIDTTGLDAMVVVGNQIFGTLGNQVIHVRYYGHEAIDKVIPLVEQVLQQKA